ncbi:MAG: Zn-dependent metalloprotease [Polaribacter sp.]
MGIKFYIFSFYKCKPKVRLSAIKRNYKIIKYLSIFDFQAFQFFITLQTQPMLKKLLSSLAIPLLLFGPAKAQKPNTTFGFEIPAIQENDSYRSGNMRISSSTGFPLAIYNPDMAVTGNNPEENARNYLTANKTLLGLTDSDISNLELHSVRTLPAGTTIRFHQYFSGLIVSKAEIAITVNPNQRVSYLANNLRYGVDIPTATPTLSMQDARQTVFDYLPITGNIIEESNELEILHTGNESKVAYRIIIAADEPLGEWEAFVDAQNGTILQLEDIGCYYKDHQEALAPGLPLVYSIFMVAGTGNVFDPDPLSSAGADYDDPGYDDNSDNTNTELTAELVSKTLQDITFDGTNYSLVGPYAEVQDFEIPNTGLYEQPSSTWDNNRSEGAFEAVNVYWHIDASMRYLNETLGLDIMPTDYSTGVRFDPHGLNNADNSHYIGSSQRLAFGDGGVDDAEDSDVIHHELGHGLHDWATNGGLSQVEGLSEGSGDYWAASYNRSLGDWDAADAPYSWVFNWDGHNEFWSGRVVNYPNTYPGGLTGGIHTQGQIWATCMMRVWDAIGQQNSDKAFWSGLAMTGGSTNQDGAANAVYQAAIDLGYSTTDVIAMHTEMTATGYILPEAPLPVELSSFSARKQEEMVQLAWTTASELNNAFYTIERRVDKDRFEVLGQVDSKDNNSVITQSYKFKDTHPNNGVNYYRLKQTDFDGTFSYSGILSVEFTAEVALLISPNPVSDRFSITGDLRDGVITVVDVSGKNQLVSFDKTGDGFDAEVGFLTPGIYFLRIETADGVLFERFVKK